MKLVLQFYWQANSGMIVNYFMLNCGVMFSHPLYCGVMFSHPLYSLDPAPTNFFLTLKWVIPVVFIQYRIIKCVLISQNTTVLAKWYIEYLQYQLHVSASTFAIIRFAFNLSSNYAICVLYCGGGGWDLVYKSGWNENLTLDRIPNIWCKYPNLTCLMPYNHSMLQSTACWMAWGSPVGPIALCLVSDNFGGSIINLWLWYCWGWILWVRWMFL
jgi:hypothetical protein